MKLIVDLDDTLCNLDHRKQYYNVDWDKYNELLIYDKLNINVNNLITCMEDIYEIVILTGRYETYRKLTEKWLRQYTSFNYTMYMKSIEDKSSSVIYKSNWIITNCDQLDWVIDDRVEIENVCIEHNIGYIKPNKLIYG